MTTSRERMTAIVQDEYGPAPEDVLRVEEIDRPVIGEDEASFAEYARARPDKLAHKPAKLSLDHAAAVPVSALAALQAVRDHGRIQTGQQVLIVGASGGVGTFAVQIAKALGAEVTGVCSTAKLDVVRALGADHVVDYTTDDFAAGEHRYEVILDIGGNRRLSHLRRALTRRGRLVIVGGETDGRWLGGVDRQLRAVLLSTFYPLSEVAAAIRYLLDGRARGKLVITVHPNR